MAGLLRLNKHSTGCHESGLKFDSSLRIAGAEPAASKLAQASLVAMQEPCCSSGAISPADLRDVRALVL